MSSDYGLGGSVVRKRADSLQLKPKVCYSQLSGGGSQFAQRRGAKLPRAGEKTGNCR